MGRCQLCHMEVPLIKPGTPGASGMRAGTTALSFWPEKEQNTGIVAFAPNICI